MPATSPKKNPLSPADALTALKEPLLRGLRVGAPVLLALLGIWVVLVAGLGGLRPVCSACHATIAQREASGPHASIACDSCHAANAADWIRLRALEGSVMPASLALRRGSTGRAGRSIGDDGCLRCHPTLRDDVVVSKGLAMRHDTCVRRWERCSDCHGGTAHGGVANASRQADMSSCLVCHDDRTAPSACDTCHKDERPKAEYKSGAWAAVHLDGKGTAHGMGDLQSCGSCHAKSKCVSCHGIELPHTASFPRTHGTTALKARKSCEVCHDRAGCDGCHGMDMPHPAGFLAAHSKSARDERDPACIKCHQQDDCDRCHVEHSHPGKQTGYSGPYR